MMKAETKHLRDAKNEKKAKKEKQKEQTPGIPTWSPTVVLTGPDDA
jgi:hypothetical protein